MKIPLDVVTFDTDVHGPGNRRDALMSKTFARSRKAHPNAPDLTIEHDVDQDAVVITMKGAAERPIIQVPWARVRYSEPLVSPAVPAKSTPKQGAAA